MWSVCSNAAVDPRHNVWSGIQTRLSAEIIEHQKQVDGLIVWDWICGTIGRPCPKLQAARGRAATVYLFPRSVPSVRNNANPEPHDLQHVGFLSALHKWFGGKWSIGGSAQAPQRQTADGGL